MYKYNKNAGLNKSTEKAKVEQSNFFTATAATMSVLHDLQYGVEKFDHFHKFTIDGIMEFNFDALHEVHVVEQEMKPWKQIAFPCDMVDWVKVGFRCGDTIKVFTQDNSIPKVFDKVDCVPQENKPCDIVDLTVTDDLIPFYAEDSYFNNNHYYGHVVSHNYAGFFDVDWRNRVINFKRTVTKANKVYLEYISTGINPNGSTFVPPYAFKALQYYVHWQRKLHDDRYGEGDKKAAKTLYDEEFHKILVRNLNMTIEDVREALSHGYKQTIKG